MPKYNLLPKVFRQQQCAPPASSITTQPGPRPTTPTSTHSVSPAHVPATTTAAPRNRALELAIERHLDKIPDAEREVFREAAKMMDEKSLLSMARSCDERHQQDSAFRPQAERLSKFLELLNRFMDGVAIGVQSNPEISSIVVGAVRVVINIAVNFVTFFHKLTDMICQFESYLSPLADYARASHDIESLQEAVATVYGDLLDFCGRARRVFVDASGCKRKWASLRVFLRQQWEPFELEFGSMKANLEHHLGVLQHSAQASLLNFERNALKSKFLLSNQACHLCKESRSSVCKNSLSFHEKLQKK
jgi:ankyrin repeat domain-containing protein 50